MTPHKHNDHINWSEIWSRYFSAYHDAVPRTGVWLSKRFRLRQKKVLEIGAGSCRDSLFLLQNGFFAIATDSCEQIIYKLQQLYPHYKPMFRCENAFSLTFEPKSFYLTFSNGLLVYFNDSDILCLLREQARVTQRYVVALVHNKLNQRLVKTFEKRAPVDPLYNIRFFTPMELLHIASLTGLRVSSVTVEKFGGPVDRLYSITKYLPSLKRFIYPFVPALYRLQPWSLAERCSMIIQLEAEDQQ